MPNALPIEAMKAAEAATDHARRVRRRHARRRTRSPTREADIELALERLREAMKPLRSEIGRFPYGPNTDKAEANRKRIRELSEAMQRERRKLWKMNKTTKETP